MNKDYIYPTTIYKSMLTQMYVFLILFIILDFYHDKFKGKNFKKYIFLQEICTFRQNALLYYSRIIVVHVHVKVFL